MVKIRIPCCATLALLALPLGLAYSAEAISLPTSSGSQRDSSILLDDRICGPRCVQYLLEYYELESEDLVDLVREIQWPEVEKGASLDRLEQALRDRGLSTASIRIPENATLRWHFPAVVHLEEKGASFGHFAVWLPESEGDHVEVWSGREGLLPMRQSDFSKLFTGVALLTSREPIVDPGSAVESHRPSALGIRPLMVALTVIGAILVVTQRLRGQSLAFSFGRKD